METELSTPLRKDFVVKGSREAIKRRKCGAKGGVCVFKDGRF